MQDNKQESDEDGKLPALDMGDFLTRPKANVGQRIPLHAPDGRLTAHWLNVRGVDSDAYIQARNRQTRLISQLSIIDNDEERDAAILEASIEIQTSLVADWSFSDPELMGEKAMKCTAENVKAFLRDAPQIGTEVERFAAKRSLFFKMPSGGLMPSQPNSST